MLPGDLFYRYRERSRAEHALARDPAPRKRRAVGHRTAPRRHRRPRRLSTLVPAVPLRPPPATATPTASKPNSGSATRCPHHADDIVADDAWPELARVLARAQRRPPRPRRPAPRARRATTARRRPDQPRRVRRAGPALAPHPTPAAPTHPTRTGPTGCPAGSPRHPPRTRTSPPPATSPTSSNSAPGSAPAPNGSPRASTNSANTPPTNHPHGPVRSGPVPDDPIESEQWIRRAGHVAAYRERWQIPDTTTDLLPPHDRGEQGRARAWVATYLRTHTLDRAHELHHARQARERDQWRRHNTRAADRHAHQRQERDEARRRRDTIAALLRETWRHEPDPRRSHHRLRRVRHPRPATPRRQPSRLRPT